MRITLRVGEQSVSREVEELSATELLALAAFFFRRAVTVLREDDLMRGCSRISGRSS